ncbi:MAG: TonB-dependent receptor [Bacteroidota bacterium]
MKITTQYFEVCWKTMSCILLIVVASTLQVYGQQKTITGTVTDGEDGTGLPGVNVLVKGTTTGTVTDFDGNYNVKASESDVLVFSFVGYVAQEVEVGQRSVIDVQLASDLKQLEEIVVIGYGTTSEKEVTGAISSIKSEDITRLNPARIENALQGQISGVQITSASGSPGGGSNIRIRGVNSNGDNRPLIIVDGVRFGDDINSIDPNIIESITVLKDASAAIYGVLAANGVILITTKTGKGLSRPELSFNAYYGWQQAERRIDVLNATEYAILTNERIAGGGGTPPFTNISSLGEGTDWQDEVFETAPIQSYSLNYRGNTEKTLYSVGGTYFDQEGIVGGDQSGFQRTTFNLNVTHELYKGLKLTANTNYINQNRQTLVENVIGSPLYNAINNDPTVPVFDENGDFTLADVNLGAEIINPLAQIENTFNESSSDRLSGVLGLQYEVLEGLTVESNFNYNFSVTQFRDFFPNIFFGNGKVQNRVFQDSTGFNIVNQNQQNFVSYNVDNIINYNTTIADVHKLKFTLGNSVFKNNGNSIFGTGFNVPNNSFEFAALNLTTEFQELRTADQAQFNETQLSYFFRTEYAFENKYLFSGLIRRDATSRFTPGNQVGYFFALSGGWAFTEDSNINLPEFLSFGKLRVSYGQLGNDRVPTDATVSAVLGTGSGEAAAVFNGNQIVFGAATGPLSNPDLQWETTETFDVGLDLEFLQGRVSVVADYYLKTTRDLLISGIQVSGLNGADAPGSSGPTINGGEVRNRGFEFSVTYSDEIVEGLNISANFNYTNNFNETLSVDGEGGFIGAGTVGIGAALENDFSRFQAGLPVGGYFGFQTDGIFQTPEEIAAEGNAQPGARPGDFRFIDQNDDGVIDNDDRTLIGSPIPTNIFGFNLNLSYKNFDLSTLWEAQTGHSLIRNFQRLSLRSNQEANAINRWTGPGSTNSFPRLTTGDQGQTLASDFFVEDGDYLRIRNIQLGYTFQSNVLEKIGAKKLRVYGTVNNVFTFTDYTGFDPSASRGLQPGDEVGGASALNGTNDIGFYPLARTYILGINLTF